MVYPYGGGSGNYTLTVSARAPSDGNGTITTTRVTTLVDASETNVSTRQTYSFALARAAEVDVALTGLTIDFDCRVGSSRCTNRWGTRDDSWSGDLAAGDHSVVVYPYDPGPGNYSLTVTATETLTGVAQPSGETTVEVCEDDEDGEEECEETVIHEEVDVEGEDPGPPPGTGPGEGDPGPGEGGDGGDGGGGGTPTHGALGTLADEIDCRGWNLDAGDRYGATRTGNDGTTYPHSGVDIQTNGRSAFRAPASAVLENDRSAASASVTYLRRSGLDLVPVRPPVEAAPAGEQGEQVPGSRVQE